jgi:hypothetical protein
MEIEGCHSFSTKVSRFVSQTIFFFEVDCDDDAIPFRLLNNMSYVISCSFIPQVHVNIPFQLMSHTNSM